MKSEGSSVDVVATVCNYNGKADLADCIEALRRQTVPPSRIVVYDNASDDGSVQLVRERFGGEVGGLPPVEVVELEVNRGPCPARNRALREADTDWVLQVDADVILADDCLERLLAQVGTPDLACIMPRALMDSDRATVHYDGGAFHYVGIMTLRNFFQPVPEAEPEVVEVDAAISTALLLSRDRVLAVGGYAEDFFILFEDHDLSYRLRAAGGKILLLPNAKVYHRHGTPGISYRQGPEYPRRRAYLHSRNRWKTLLRNHSWRALLLGAPGIAAYELTWCVFATTQGMLGAYLQGKWDLLRGLPQLFAERRQIQSQRAVRDRDLLRAEPLTHAPMVRRGGFRQLAEGGLNRVLRGWWALVRWLL